MRDFIYFVCGCLWMPVYANADTLIKQVACWLVVLILAVYSVFRSR
ncbi:hypothetical protein KGB38_gp02 [Salmonella phage vB_SenS_SB28]|uniref:Uncharacterized protein n=1 Tax=Salmonella phage vB_SenS_SB28 TaxID=2591136 RepID=A0A5J6T9V5_9CAUD|nr:hypothetical protein KGB38_gp02 [Salmonella phage vB_SenS_SB28]QFG07743.1 hypothetical protein [Salmonella phage vB_SenS_SB28]